MSSNHNGRGSGPRDRQGGNEGDAPLLFSIHSALDGEGTDAVPDDADPHAGNWDQGESGGFPPRLTLVLPDEASAEDAIAAEDATSTDEPSEPVAVERFDDSDDSIAADDEGDAAADDDEIDAGEAADDFHSDLGEDDDLADDQESEPLAAESALDDAEATEAPIGAASEPQQGGATAEAACTAIEWAGGDLSAWRCGASAVQPAAEPANVAAQPMEAEAETVEDAVAPAAEFEPADINLAASTHADANESELAAPVAATEPLSVADLAAPQVEAPPLAASVETQETLAEPTPRQVQLEFETVPDAARERRFESPRQSTAAAAGAHDSARAKPRRVTPPAWIGAGRLALERFPITPADALAWIRAEPAGGFRWRAMWATAAATAACGVIGIVLLRTVLA